MTYPFWNSFWPNRAINKMYEINVEFTVWSTTFQASGGSKPFFPLKNVFHSSSDLSKKISQGFYWLYWGSELVVLTFSSYKMHALDQSQYFIPSVYSNTKKYTIKCCPCIQIFNDFIQNLFIVCLYICGEQ